MMSSFYSILTNKSQDIQEDTLIRDIETHLSDLLNARQYMSLTSSNYGLPDICAEYTLAYATKAIEATRELIKRYEPRVSIRQIHYDKEIRAYHQLTLNLIATVADEALIEFEAKIGSQSLSTVRAA